SLCVLKINYYYGHLISNGGKRISPERIPPPASGSTVQYRALKRLALLTIPHESLSQLERLFPALCQIRLYNLPGYCPKASKWNHCDRCLANGKYQRCEIASIWS